MVRVRTSGVVAEYRGAVAEFLVLVVFISHHIAPRSLPHTSLLGPAGAADFLPLAGRRFFFPSPLVATPLEGGNASLGFAGFMSAHLFLLLFLFFVFVFPFIVFALPLARSSCFLSPPTVVHSSESTSSFRLLSSSSRLFREPRFPTDCLFAPSPALMMPPPSWSL